MGGPVIIGYYRFTDIFFEWHKALPKLEDISPLKAMLAYDALVHPDHPLHKPQVDGIEMYLGTFANGEMRLLFSSAQVEYIRYWLHAVGLTDTLIPIPSSEYLIQAADLTGCSPSVYNDAGTLKKAVKVRPRRPRRPRARIRCSSRALQSVDKNNKRLKGTGSLLTARRLAFEKVRTLWAAQAGTWLAVDFEAWDRDHTLLTEFGWSLVRWDAGAPVEEAGHLVVRERRGYRSTYVAQYRDNYNFGQSEDVSKDEFRDRICALVAAHSAAGPLFLVFHDSSQDIKYLRSEAVKAVTELEYILPDAPPSKGIFVVDTAEMFSALEGEASANKRGLDRVCRHLHIPTEFLHNAGNDYTMLALREMAAGEPVDEQREKRWPNRTTSSNPRVEFKAWEEDSDPSDLEGLMPIEEAVASEQFGFDM
ncbi:hypothetical protein B0H21DRAFT_183121 [Amylocystis lapponica]|nr:hypothetical protein B0H21DRAFT_183121 [Amylocystis lapponica]